MENLDPKLVTELSKIIGWLVITNIGVVISLFVWAIKITWFVSKLHHKTNQNEKYLNGFGGRVKRVEETNHTLQTKVAVLESKLDE